MFFVPAGMIRKGQKVRLAPDSRRRAGANFRAGAHFSSKALALPSVSRPPTAPEIKPLPCKRARGKTRRLKAVCTNLTLQRARCRAVERAAAAALENLARGPARGRLGRRLRATGARGGQQERGDPREPHFLLTRGEVKPTAARGALPASGARARAPPNGRPEWANAPHRPHRARGGSPAAAPGRGADPRSR